jgi:hypothetical protein
VPEFLKEFSIDDQSKPQLVGILEIQPQELLILLKIYHLFMIFPMMVNILHARVGKDGTVEV